MNNCKNCKYWGDGFKPDEHTHNTCGAIGIDEPTTKDAAFVDVYADDDSGMSVRFKTLATFYCSLHKSK